MADMKELVYANKSAWIEDVKEKIIVPKYRDISMHYGPDFYEKRLHSVFQEAMTLGYPISNVGKQIITQLVSKETSAEFIMQGLDMDSSVYNAEISVTTEMLVHYIKSFLIPYPLRVFMLHFIGSFNFYPGIRQLYREVDLYNKKSFYKFLSYMKEALCSDDLSKLNECLLVPIEFTKEEYKLLLSFCYKVEMEIERTSNHKVDTKAYIAKSEHVAYGEIDGLLFDIGDLIASKYPEIREKVLYPTTWKKDKVKRKE